MVVVSLLVIEIRLEALQMMQELARVVQLRLKTLVSFVTAGQVLLGTGLEIGLVPARAAEAEAWHG